MFYKYAGEAACRIRVDRVVSVTLSVETRNGETAELQNIARAEI